MDVEGTAARGQVVGGRDAESGGLDHPLSGPVHVPLPGIHHAAGEEVDIGTGGRQRFLLGGQLAQPEPGGNQVRLLGHRQSPGAKVQQSGIGQGLERQPLPAWGDPALLGQGLPGLFHQVPVGDRGRAGRFAAPTLHASGEGVDDLIGDRDVVELHFPHQGDATTGRFRLLPGHPERRAERQAESALHADVEVVLVEFEIHVRCAYSPTRRPGFNRLVGSNWALIRSDSSRTTASDTRWGWGTVANTVPTPTEAT